MRLEICLYLLYREHRERGQEGSKDRGEGRHTDARDARDARDKDERDERRGPELKESRLDATVRKYLKGIERNLILKNVFMFATVGFLSSHKPASSLPNGLHFFLYVQY
jgi:hypothetical protein